MKKITLLILFGLLFSWASFAQVPIGPQDGNTANMPINSCFDYSYSQQIVYQEEINAVPGDITSLSFYYDTSTTTSTSNSSNWTIYVGHTNRDRFATNAAWIPVASLTQVFSGTVTFPAQGNFMVVTFDTPFPYNNVDNLVIAVDENSPGKNCTLNFGKTANLGQPRSIYFRSETQNPDPATPPQASARANYINNMILGGIQESCPAASNLVANNITESTVDVSWTENGSSTEWEVLYGPVGFNPNNAGTVLIDNDGTPGTTISGLAANTNYEFYVTSLCGTDDNSARIGPKAFKTACGTITSLPYIENMDTYGTGSNAFPTCWERITYTSGTVWPSIVAQSGTPSAPNSLKFQSAVGTPTYAISPPFADDIHSLRVSFMLKREAANSGTMQVGVMSNPLDPSTFELVATINPSNNDYTAYEYNLNNTTLSGANNHIALRHNSNSNIYYYWLDNFVVDPIPSCPKPTDLTAVTVATTSADIAWTAGGSETSWNISWGTPGFTVGGAAELGSSTSSTASFQITGLSPSSNYEFYVQANCGVDDLSYWSGPKAFSTTCDAITSLPYIENMDTYGTGSNAFPSCWERITYTSGTVWPSIVAQTGTPSSPNSLKFQSAVGTPTYAVSPPFADDIHSLRVSFMLRREGNSSGNMQVGVMSNPLDPSTFELVATINPSTNDYIAYEYNLNNTTLSGANIHIALRHNSDSSAWYYWLDNFMVDPIPSCPKPTALTSIAVTTTTADIAWTAGGSETSWNVSWGTPGFTVGGAGELGSSTSGTTSFEITGLSPSSHYEFYVQANCGVDDLSYWSGPMAFSTACAAITSLPYIENMDTYGTGSNAFPSCWERITYTSGTVWPSIVSGNATSSPNSLKFQSAIGTPTYAVSPPFAADIHSLRVSFMLKREGGSSGTMQVGVMSNPLDPSTFELVATINPSNNDYIAYEYNLNNTTLSGANIHIALRHNADSAIWYYWLDNFVVDPIPSCPKPTDLTVGIVDEDSAQLSWTEAASATQWEVLYGVSGFNPDTQGTVQVVNGTPVVTINGLNSSTAYDFYVTAICAVDDQSLRSGPASFRTSCVPSSVPFFEGFESGYTHNQPLAGCWSQTSQTGTEVWTVNNTFTDYNRAPRTGGWNAFLRFSNSDWMYYPLVLTEGVAYELTFYARQNVATGVTVEAAFGTANNPAAMTTNIVPASPVVAGDYQEFKGYFTPNASGTFYIGIKGTLTGTPWYISIDDISVVEAPTCMPPSNLMVDSVTENSADVSWTPFFTAETVWDIAYGTPGFNPETGGTIVRHEGAPEATIMDLNPSTAYEFYVRAVCTDDDMSTWTGPMSFITECVSVNLPYTLDFEEIAPPTLPSCTSVQTVSGINSWETAYVNENGFTGKALRYKWNSQQAANTWFYTEGLNLIAGVEYQISYKYGNNSTTSSERMKVAYGTSPIATSMTNQLVDYNNITGGTPTIETLVFTVPADGVYYFGFHAYSLADRFYLFLDDIHIRHAADCDIVTNFHVTNVSGTSVSVSWDASATATEGYVVEVFQGGANPVTATPVASQTVAAGATTATIEGLTPETSYDVYVTSDCGNGNVSRSGRVRFSTIALSVNNNNYTQISYFPNPVKDQLTITAANPIESVTVYNLLGQTIMEVQSNGLEVVLDMAALPTGTYVLKTNVGIGMSTFKVIKQ